MRKAAAYFATHINIATLTRKIQSQLWSNPCVGFRDAVIHVLLRVMPEGKSFADFQAASEMQAGSSR